MNTTLWVVIALSAYIITILVVIFKKERRKLKITTLKQKESSPIKIVNAPNEKLVFLSQNGEEIFLDHSSVKQLKRILSNL